MKIHTTIYTYTFLILLAGCGGGGGSSSPPAQEPLPDPPVTVSGVVLDGPVSGGTLFFFSLLGLVMSLLGDLPYTLVDPRIDFESRET